MLCEYEIIGTENGENHLRCLRRDCNHEVNSAYGPELVTTSCRATRSRLVGDNLHNILLGRYGAAIVQGCSCGKWVRGMNRWGPDGCREHIDEIIDSMLAEARKRKWKLHGRPWLSVAARVGSMIPLATRVIRERAGRLVLEAIEQAGVNHATSRR